MVKTGIPVKIFYIVFGIGILLSIGLIVIVAKSGKYSGITKNIIIWFAVLMIINLANLMFTFVYYEKRKTIKGSKGQPGVKGPRGFPGENMKCGNNLCGSIPECPDDEKDKEGNCFITGGTKQEKIDNKNGMLVIKEGIDKESDVNIKEDQCIFPFVYNYKNQYAPLKKYDKNSNGEYIPTSNPDYPKEGDDRMGLPEGGEYLGVCATSLNDNKTAKTWGYLVGNSTRAKEMSYTNRKGNNNKAQLEKDMKQMGILDVKIATADTDKEASCPKGYDRIDGDLNQGAGAYVYLCAKNGVSTIGVTGLGIVEGDNRCSSVFPESKKEEITRLTTDLNKDTNVGQVNPQELYMCVKKQEYKPNRPFLTDIQIKETDDFNTTNNVYTRVNIGNNTNNADLNKDTTGSPVYLYTTTQAKEINPLRSAFYIPNKGTLYFTMGEDGKDIYTYNNTNREIGVDSPLLEKDLLINIVGKDVPKRYEVIAYLGNRLFVFKGRFVSEIDFNTKTKKMGFPKKIENLFPGIPQNLDAAYVHPANKDFYFFKDKLVYRFRPIPSNAGASLGKLLTGYPKNISTEFKGAPDYPDAVFTVPNEKERKHTFIAKATTFKVFDEDNLLIQDVDTISLDNRFGLQTNAGFKKTEIDTFANRTLSVIETFDNLEDQEYEKPKPEPYKCPKNARKFDIENKECAPNEGNMEAEGGNGPSKTLGGTELKR